jgi:hypothetical protein
LTLSIGHKRINPSWKKKNDLDVQNVMQLPKSGDSVPYTGETHLIE